MRDLLDDLVDLGRIPLAGDFYSDEKNRTAETRFQDFSQSPYNLQDPKRLVDAIRSGPA